MIRSSKEIVERIRQRSEADWFGFEWGEYLLMLPFEQAKEFLKPDTTSDDWEVYDLDRISDSAKSYMNFFLEKIEGERGISVGRATSHYIAWKWLLGHPDSDTFPGSINGSDGGWYQRDAYNYLKAQMDSGLWDEMTRAAQEAQ